MKRALVLSGIASLLLAAATVWWLKSRSFEVRVTEPQLRAQLIERFPIERTVLLLLRWRLTDPSLEFLPQRQRVAIGIDARLNLKLEGGRSDLGGRIELETGIRYDAARGALFLVDPVITRLVIDGLPERHAQRATDSVRELLAEVFSQRPVYTLNPLDLKQGSARLLLRELRIEDDAVVVRLGL
jgi:hypothetical protein